MSISLKRARSTGSEENGSGSDISCSYQFTLVRLENEKEDLEKELFDLTEQKNVLEQYQGKMEQAQHAVTDLVLKYDSAEGEMKDFYKSEIEAARAIFRIRLGFASSSLEKLPGVYSRIDAIYERRRSINSEIADINTT